MALTFTAIDFETANQHRYSACAVGLAKVVDGIVVDSTSMLIQPPASVEFHPMNTRVHGLTRLDVAGAPNWGELWPWLMNMVGDDVLVAHNASFDRSVMRNACEKNGIAWHDPIFACTYRTAQSVLRLGSYSLPWVARDLGVEEFDHHDARADALAAAGIAIKLAHLMGADDIGALLPGPRKSKSSPRAVIDYGQITTVKPILEGETVCFTGALKSMPRGDARELVHTFGATSQPGVNKNTTILVVGDFDMTTLRPGAKISSKLQKAFDLVSAGQQLEIFGEAEFFELVSMLEEEFDAGDQNGP